MTYGYFAFEGFEKELDAEILFKTKKQAVQKGRLFLFEKELDLVWAQLKLGQLHTKDFDSISQAAHFLRNLKRTWASYAFHLYRRTELIEQQVRPPKTQLINFLQELPDQDWGFWCLVEEKKLIYSTSTQKSYPLGNVKFNEDKVSPPSRAYLKLWELFTFHIKAPQKRQRVIDLGSCPGGWTWVLQKLGCHVISVDKAPLDPAVAKLPNIEYIKKDAFKLDPSQIAKPQWLFSDIICDPPKLLELVNSWLHIHPDLNMACTIKYKGHTDFETTTAFAQIPNSQLIHLHHNKHEVTWVHLPL